MNTREAQVRSTLETGDVMLLVMSGKMGSGKDTLAPLVADRLGYPNAVHLYYADALKDELDDILGRIRSGSEVAEVAATCDVSTDQVHALLDLLGNLHTCGHARSRTPQMRSALQYWGTGVRRASDDDYWVRITLSHAVDALSCGRSVYITDARFPNEIEQACALGGFAVRLDISEEVQRERLWERDGVLPAGAATWHTSEVALDDHCGFTLRFANHGSIDAATDVIAAAWRAWQ